MESLKTKHGVVRTVLSGNKRKPGVEMGKRVSFEPGQTIEVPNYPFVRFVFHGFDICRPSSESTHGG